MESSDKGSTKDGDGDLLQQTLIEWVLSTSIIKNSLMRIFLVLLVYLAVLLSVVLAKGYSTDKRLQNPSGFNTMMRYGRSSNRNVDNKRPVVYPRADNFFLGPRYGKRSTTWNPSESLVYPVQGGPICGQYEDLACTWTGLSNLYKCTLRKDLVVSSN